MGDFIEHVEYGGNLYGTQKADLNSNQDLIWKIDPSFAGKVKQNFKDAVVIFLYTDKETIIKRLQNRGLGNLDIQKRMEEDNRFWKQYGQNYDHIVENTPGNLEKAIGAVIQIIQGK